MTEERRRELDQLRAQALARDVKKGEEGGLVDGGALLRQLLEKPAPAPAPAKEKEKVLVGARRR